MIIGIEGPNLTGKTTMVEELKKLFERNGISCTKIREYVDYLGDQNKQPERPLKTIEDMINEGRFYIDLEKIRQRDIAEAMQTAEFVIIDRTFFTCLAYAQISENPISGEMFKEYVNSESYILPDLIIFLKIDPKSDEYQKRMEARKANNPKCRGLNYKIAEYSYIYRNKDYEMYFANNVAPQFENIVFLDTLKTKPEDIYRLLTEQR